MLLCQDSLVSTASMHRFSPTSDGFAERDTAALAALKSPKRRDYVAESATALAVSTVSTKRTIQAGSALLLPLFSFPLFYFVFSAFPSAGSEGTKNRVP